MGCREKGCAHASVISPRRTQRFAEVCRRPRSTKGQVFCRLFLRCRALHSSGDPASIICVNRRHLRIINWPSSGEASVAHGESAERKTKDLTHSLEVAGL